MFCIEEYYSTLRAFQNSKEFSVFTDIFWITYIFQIRYFINSSFLEFMIFFWIHEHIFKSVKFFNSWIFCNFTNIFFSQTFFYITNILIRNFVRIHIAFLNSQTFVSPLSLSFLDFALNIEIAYRFCCFRILIVVSLPWLLHLKAL